MWCQWPTGWVSTSPRVTYFAIGLLATAEALGFLVGCLYAHKIIVPVGLERAYAAFAGMKAVAILGLHFADSAALQGSVRMAGSE